MSLPNEPVTRGEQYLNAIAIGDNSGIPAEPVTREEMYLDYIAKNGGGGGSSGGGVLVFTDNNGVLDHTWQEIHDADLPVFISDLPDGGGTIRSWNTYIMATDDPSYTIVIDGLHYTVSSADGYPVYQDG